MSQWRAHLEQRQAAHLNDFVELLSFPSISAQPHMKDHVQACAEWLAARFKAAGFVRAEVMATPGHPVVYAEHCPHPDKPTLLFYGHYDVQPADNPERWLSPPFEPTVDGDRIRARGASDMKGQVIAFLQAAEALIAHGGLPINIKVIVEGEEEIGSPNLSAFIEQNRAMLEADYIVSGDSGQVSETQPGLVLGTRGICGLEFTLTGPGHDLHSGSWGGAVQNPLHAIAELVASLHRPDGGVAVEGFYDQVEPLTEADRQWFAKIPFDEAKELGKLKLETFYGEAGYTTLERQAGRPTLEINGLWGGYTGAGSMTVIPAQAHAKITCRLVPRQDPAKIIKAVTRHLEAHCPKGTRIEVRAREFGAFAFRIGADHPVNQAAKAVLSELYGVEPVELMFGGSVPVLATFQQLFGKDPVSLGFGLDDELIHSPNEYFRLSSYEKGKLAYGMFLEQLAKI